jgi:hypothetical protein
MGPLLQSLAILKQAPTDRPDVQNLDKSMRDIYKGLVDVCGNASAKAGLSPLGRYFHDVAYPILSQIVHQDFSVTHEYVATLEAGTPKALEVEELKSFTRWLDLIITAVVCRILDDVGSPFIGEPSKSSELNGAAP